MRRSRPVRRVVAVSLVLACMALLSQPRPQQTDAAFTDTEFTSGTTLTALRLVPPQMTAVSTCQSPLLGGTTMVVTWKWAAQTAPYTGFTATNTEWQIAGAAWQAVPTTGPDVNGVFTTTFSSSLLFGVLGGLFGETFSSNVRTKAWTTWTSPTVSTLTYTKPLLFNPTCTFVNGS